MPPLLKRAVIALLIAAYFLYHAGAGLRAGFTGDDVMNLYWYWTDPWSDILLANFLWFSPYYRPLGGLFYRVLYAVAGFDPFPFRLACYGLMLLNLYLLYRFASRATGSAFAGALACLIGAYHARLDDLYFSTGTVYDLLCYTFYLSALLYWWSVRDQERHTAPRSVLLFLLLYAAALNAKEMAATLPVVLLLYEWIHHPPEGFRGIPTWLRRLGPAPLAAMLMTIPYYFGKTGSSSILSPHPAYALSLAPDRLIGNLQAYLNLLVYQDGSFSPARIAAFAGASLLVIAALKPRAMLFGLLFFCVAALPALAIQQRSLFVLYLPLAGLAVSLAAALARLPIPRAVLLAAVALLLVRAHRVQHSRSSPCETGGQCSIQMLASQMKQIHPQLARESSILFLNDPFPRDNWAPLFTLSLLYADDSLRVVMAKMWDQPFDPASFNHVFTWDHGALVELDPIPGKPRR